MSSAAERVRNRIEEGKHGPSNVERTLCDALEIALEHLEYEVAEKHFDGCEHSFAAIGVLERMADVLEEKDHALDSR